MRSMSFWIAVAACAAMVVGAFGPWAKGLNVGTVRGTDYSDDGWLVVGCAVVAAALVFAGVRSGVRAPFVLAFFLGALSFGVALSDRHEVSNLEPIVQAGWGLSVALVGSAVLALGAGFLIVQRRAPA
jgi:hypothetical protein